MDLAMAYLQHLVESLALGLGIWLLVVLGPRIGVRLPLALFMPTAYTVALSFFRHPTKDRVRALSFAVLIGAIFLVIITSLGPLVGRLAGVD